MEYKTFSCYDNFVPCNQSGVPSHTSTNNGLTHLKKLISTISNKLKTMTSEDFKCALDLSRKAIIYEDSVSYVQNYLTVVCMEKLAHSKILEINALKYSFYLINSFYN